MRLSINMGWMFHVLEVVVFAIWIHLVNGSNLAYLKPATASSSPGPTSPETAVDGVNVTTMDVYNGVFCCHVETKSIFGWWQVDLEVTVRVGSVRITTATYEYGRPTDFLLEVYPDPSCNSESRICHQYSGTLPGGESTTIYCSTPVRGRTVRFSQVAPFFLCEVEVYQATAAADSSLTFRGEAKLKQIVVSGMTLIKYPGNRKAVTSSVQVDTASMFDCGQLCLSHDMCPYFNFQKRGNVGLCEIPSIMNGSDVISSDADWDYYEQDPCEK